LTKDEAKSSVDGMGWTATFNGTLEETNILAVDCQWLSMVRAYCFGESPKKMEI